MWTTDNWLVVGGLLLFVFGVTRSWYRGKTTALQEALRLSEEEVECIMKSQPPMLLRKVEGSELPELGLAQFELTPWGQLLADEAATDPKFRAELERRASGPEARAFVRKLEGWQRQASAARSHLN